jgi:hypothetical protein
MMADQPRNPGERRAEPEIIPPGRDSELRGPGRIWTRLDDSSGVHRVYILRPSLPWIIFGLLVVGVVVAALFLVLAGVVLLWLPILIGGILLALLSGSLRYRWHRLQGWFAGRR